MSFLKWWLGNRQRVKEAREHRLNQPAQTSAQAQAQTLRLQGRNAEAHWIEFMERKEIERKKQNALDFPEIHTTV